MMRVLVVWIISAALGGCAPPRWSQTECWGKPETWGKSEAAVAALLGPLTNEQLLDVAACNLASSHPSRQGFPERFIAERAPDISDTILSRLEVADQDMVSMGYVDMLQIIQRDAPKALSAGQLKRAHSQCVRQYQSEESCAAFQQGPRPNNSFKPNSLRESA